MNEEYTSITDRGTRTVPATGDAIRLDDSASQGRKNVTITNRSSSEVFVLRTYDPGGSLSAPTAAFVQSNWTVRLPAGSVMDDPAGDFIAYYGAVTTGTASVGVQECF
jgi:hypothetical protein